MRVVIVLCLLGFSVAACAPTTTEESVSPAMARFQFQLWCGYFSPEVARGAVELGIADDTSLPIEWRVAIRAVAENLDEPETSLPMETVDAFSFWAQANPDDWDRACHQAYDTLFPSPSP